MKLTVSHFQYDGVGKIISVQPSSSTLQQQGSDSLGAVVVERTLVGHHDTIRAMGAAVRGDAVQLLTGGEDAQLHCFELSNL